ncbi:MAG: molybdopterin molybdotransferase MoeA [Desulfobacterales bacterium]|nr:molybdopterin molybdotransferase MoeA [Desulfobacterales bacterium]
MESFFKVKKSEEVFNILRQFGPSEEEAVSPGDSPGRVLSGDVIASEDLPGFSRSVVDGYAVRARDTFGASESIPAFLNVCGEVSMGRTAKMVVRQGLAAKIATGGMLPEGADGIVMKEYCRLLDNETLEVSRAVSPLENIIQPGDDFKKGAVVLKKGHILRPQDVGVMAGFGRTLVSVFKKPRVAIISTGDEIVSVDSCPAPGQVRDINQFTLEAFCRRTGAEPLCLGLCPDDLDALRALVKKAMAQAETVWISGGSSVGTRDLTLKVFETLPDFQVLVHGISISPGKPTIIAKSGHKPVIGLPGHVASALVVAEVFLGPLILRLAGQSHYGPVQARIHAELSQNIESTGGREDYVRVKVEMVGETLIAKPIFGKSGLISTLVEADGLIRIDMNTEGLYQGQIVKVMPFGLISGAVS